MYLYNKDLFDSNALYIIEFITEANSLPSLLAKSMQVSIFNLFSIIYREISKYK